MNSRSTEIERQLTQLKKQLVANKAAFDPYRKWVFVDSEFPEVASIRNTITYLEGEIGRLEEELKEEQAYEEYIEKNRHSYRVVRFQNRARWDDI